MLHAGITGTVNDNQTNCTDIASKPRPDKCLELVQNMPSLGKLNILFLLYVAVGKVDNIS